MTTRLMIVALVALTTLPALAQQEKKKRANANPANQLLKQLSDVELSDEQVAKIKELGAKTQESIKKVSKEAGLTAQVLKKRREAVASLKDSDKKGKAKIAEINEKAGLDEAQVSAVTKSNEMRQKLKADIVGLLSDEQKEKLPKAFQRTVKRKKKQTT